MSMSTKGNNPVSLSNYPQPKNINLPRLERIMRNGGNRNGGQEPKKHEAVSLKPRQVDISSMLKIQGKGSQQGRRIEYERDLARNVDRDIRAELKKIYNLKPSPKKHSRRIVELPRIN